MKLRTKVITIVIILALAAYALISTFYIWRLTIPLNQLQDDLRLEIAEMEQKIAELAFRLEHSDDPIVIRQIAEEMLGLVSPDEIIIFNAPAP